MFRKVKIKEDILTRHSDSRLEDLQLAKTLDYLKINVFLLIFSNLLLERKVIFLSSSLRYVLSFKNEITLV